MCCDAVGEDVCEGSGGSEGGALSVSCSGACGPERLLETDDPTGGQTAVEQSLGLELLRDRPTKREYCTTIKIID